MTQEVAGLWRGGAYGILKNLEEDSGENETTLSMGADVGRNNTKNFECCRVFSGCMIKAKHSL